MRQFTVFTASTEHDSKTINTITCVNRIKGEAATAASVKHKCYSLTSMMYYLNMTQCVL